MFNLFKINGFDNNILKSDITHKLIIKKMYRERFFIYGTSNFFVFMIIYIIYYYEISFFRLCGKCDTKTTKPIDTSAIKY